MARPIPSRTMRSAPYSFILSVKSKSMYLQWKECIDQDLEAKENLLTTAVSQWICPGRNASTLAAALAVKSGNNKIIHQDSLTALANATNDLSMPCHERRY